MPVEFRRAARLRSRDQFDRVQRGGRRVSTRLFTLVASPNALDSDRLGIIASRRLGGAVVRNRAKRRIREVFRRRLMQDPSPAGRGLDLVVVARHAVTEAPYSTVDADFQAALRQLRGVK
jgi:ribonuclease P protein component